MGVPELLPENIEVYEIYQMVRDQHIMGARGPVELNLIPVFKVMEMRNVKNPEQYLNLIRTVYSLDLERLYRSK